MYNWLVEAKAKRGVFPWWIDLYKGIEKYLHSKKTNMDYVNYLYQFGNKHVKVPSFVPLTYGDPPIGSL